MPWNKNEIRWGALGWERKSTVQRTATWGLRPVDTYQSWIDSFQRASEQTVNFGTAVSLPYDFVGGDANAPIFGPAITDSSVIAKGATIDAASVNIYISSNGEAADQSMIIRLLQKDWVESEITAVIYSTGNDWDQPMGGGPLDTYAGKGGSELITAGYTGWVSIDIPQDFQDWCDDTVPNFYGWNCQPLPLFSGWAFHSSEYVGDTSLRPYVSVTWTQ